MRQPRRPAARPVTYGRNPLARPHRLVVLRGGHRAPRARRARGVSLVWGEGGLAAIPHNAVGRAPMLAEPPGWNGEVSPTARRVHRCATTESHDRGAVGEGLGAGGRPWCKVTTRGVAADVRRVVVAAAGRAKPSIVLYVTSRRDGNAHSAPPVCRPCRGLGSCHGARSLERVGKTGARFRQ